MKNAALLMGIVILLTIQSIGAMAPKIKIVGVHEGNLVLSVQGPIVCGICETSPADVRWPDGVSNAAHQTCYDKLWPYEDYFCSFMDHLKQPNGRIKDNMHIKYVNMLETCMRERLPQMKTMKDFLDADIVSDTDIKKVCVTILRIIYKEANEKINVG